jgi:parallel beta-helix repeat protein
MEHTRSIQWIAIPVLLENCIAIGASDAGIYVGQSRDIIVTNCEAYHNVAGIEIENCIRADVYDNNAHGNTGGILIFDMPGLTQDGSLVRVYNNKIKENNFRNFAPEGNIVGRSAPRDRCFGIGYQKGGDFQ